MVLKQLKPIRGVIILMTIMLTVFAIYLVSYQESSKIDSLQVKAGKLTGDRTRGEYVAISGGCIACHTNFDANGKFLAGGVPMKTSFGTFYSPNITSDRSAGIGQWTTTEFMIAMTVGKSPQNRHYFPVFPYTSYTVMTAQDLVDLKAWLDTVNPVSTSAREHEIMWPFSYRPAMVFWKAVFFDPGGSVKTKDRGSYLVNGPGHCSECHSRRNFLGGITNRSLGGNANGPDGAPVPGITADDLSDWTVEDITFFLGAGITESGDFTGGHMTDVIDHSTSLLTDQDRVQIAEYLLSDANLP